jgi:hypothetical protein
LLSEIAKVFPKGEISPFGTVPFLELFFLHRLLEEEYADTVYNKLLVDQLRHS